MEFIKLFDNLYIHRRNIVGYRIAPTSKDSMYKVMVMTTQGIYDSKLLESEEEAIEYANTLFYGSLRERKVEEHKADLGKITYSAINPTVEGNIDIKPTLIKKPVAKKKVVKNVTK